MTTTKSVEWAYPSSPNAVKYGFAKEGCWVVLLHENDGQAASVVAAYDEDDFTTAVITCDLLPHGWLHGYFQTTIGERANKVMDDYIEENRWRLG